MPRTDNDSWDLATSVGATATMVAAARAVATKADKPLINDPFAEPLVRAVGIEFLARWANGEIDAADIDVADEAWGLQRMADLMGVRTPYFDAFFRDAMDAGIRQAVILASGLDARAYRLSWPAGATVFEIDQPEVLQFKNSTLADLDVQPATALRVVPIDLRDDWPTALREKGFDATQPSAWIAEGLLAFLPPDAQDRLLDNITDLATPGSRLAAEIFGSRPDENGDQAPDMVAVAGERWREYGFDVVLADLRYDVERSDVGAYLEGHGWQTEVRTLNQLFADNGLAEMPSVAGDPAADAYYCTAIRQP
ncbi:class I SAM-dependent methyltransferase [Mycobacterium montefiorense]|uniref:S-adenosyl-L-methionine-dependent methyltransferase n=1 Tax=Mycobacterium montefiorense TaxID=154654 RepID=A0AA37PK40_9MYCO|nr:class I SAM-dependent methyltransferase [Mycobacterium montefiorense]GBG38983.1 putative S-adenosyl-L-methionine-dependent methyltransferase [Mycobacterium montefiorense]GKU32771.1 putative S-adenosyl-L-methionine-dependent methyltransferase [Mycobacterium montefiorense]GKU38293.1 putative S-adenosyl-L-methionine-dependent methyltransferase [Mycobacterium montefiorense]GKU47439.1 putative S-adenosyl-L-methionine-dependent methyltransferase [Mycobacterium montefiorense]GKU50322.1 putative S-